jgi:FMN-dependent oxidoreductase (nitrilotriacetate monooxygenase family)
MFHLGWFMGSGFSVQTWALDPWAGNTGHDWMRGDLFVDLATSLERARFDYLLVEDTSMVEDAYGRSMETTLKYGLLAPKCDPVPLIPLLTQRTKHIGIAVTLSTSFYHPFMAARTMTTLDHLSEGRVGLNVVTGSSTRAAQQYGYDALMLHSERYAMAKEWMEAVGALWDSWEEGAVLVDQETPRYADHTKVHTVDFEGKYFRTRGPLNTIPGPQRRPVIVQAGASPAGRDLAAKFAESMLAHGTSIEQMKAFRQDMHRRMKEYGRDPSTGAVPGLGIAARRALVYGCCGFPAARRAREPAGNPVRLRVPPALSRTSGAVHQRDSDARLHRRHQPAPGFLSAHDRRDRPATRQLNQWRNASAIAAHPPGHSAGF